MAHTGEQAMGAGAGACVSACPAERRLQGWDLPI